MNDESLHQTAEAHSDDLLSTEAEAIPRPQVGQVWRPQRGGMWRTIIAIHPAGVEWTASPHEHWFVRFETWEKWVRDAGAFTMHDENRTTVREVTLDEKVGKLMYEKQQIEDGTWSGFRLGRYAHERLREIEAGLKRLLGT
jgi:hypothetical protein